MKSFFILFLFLSLFVFGQVKDKQGNTYSTVKIGNQLWMSENLKSSVFNDGTSIPYVSSSKQWMETTKPAYCYYQNNIENKHQFGLLYNFYTIESTKICPIGWHVPTESEWQELICFVGDEQNAALFLKNPFGWLENGIGLDDFNFSALPNGGRKYTGVYDELLSHGSWWSATAAYSIDEEKDYGISFQMCHWNSNVISWINKKQEGYAIRCVKD